MTFEDVRAIALAFPGVEERASYEGRPSFRTKKRMIVWLQDESGSISIYLPFEVRDALCAEQPKVFLITEHYRNYPAVLTRLKGANRALLAELIEDAWRLAATKKQISEWEASR